MIAVARHHQSNLMLTHGHTPYSSAATIAATDRHDSDDERWLNSSKVTKY